MPIDFNPYHILGVSVSSSPEDIKANYRRMARRLHPDTNLNNPAAALQFQDVNRAYEILIDAVERNRLDMELAKHQSLRPSFSMRVTPSRRTIPVIDETQILYLLVDMIPDINPDVLARKREARVNLTLVIDHSNSMNGNRLERVKVAAQQIIDQLRPDDILSLVVFNDRAEVVIPATQVKDKPSLKARVSMTIAVGGTEIFQGLEAGVEENQKYLSYRMVNHLILLTDGNTYGDHERCIKLAQTASKQGITISAMGLGHDWNDKFLDELASATGGSCLFINSSSAVVRFMNDHVRALANAFAERMHISVAADPDIRLENVFKLTPSPLPLSMETGAIPLGSLQAHRAIGVLVQLEIPPGLPVGFRSIARIVASGDILEGKEETFTAISDFSLNVQENDFEPEEPPPNMVDALSRYTLYRMQERAQESLERGDFKDATRRLEHLATRLLEIGETELAQQAKSEAKMISHTRQFSNAGRMTLKFQTRLLLSAGNEENQT